MSSTLKKYLEPFEIKGIPFDNRIWLAPLAGYSHKALRIMARNFGAGFAVTEMVSIEGLIRGDKKTRKYLELENAPIAVQIFGTAKPDRFLKAAELLKKEYAVRVVDVNFGCPVRKVVRSGAGSALLKTPEMMCEIIKAVKSTGVLTGAKIRIGFDNENTELTIPALDEAGIDILTIHGRTAKQGYTGRADWQAIARARKMTDTFLVANGDIKTPEDAERVIETTECDAVMIGRAGIGTPFIFSQINDYFNKGTYIRQYDRENIKSFMREFADMYCKVSSKDSIIPIRSALIQYVHNFDGSKEIRRAISLCVSRKELENILNEWN